MRTYHFYYLSRATTFNSANTKLVTLAPGLHPERRFAPLAQGQQVRDIGSKFINNVEISAQEAVYIVLQLPMRKASRQIVFVHTSPPEERVKLLKPLE